MEYELTIIGGGPAAAAAAVYAARKQLNTVLITKDFGGQSVVSSDIQNWIGTPHISGADLAKALKAHVEEYKGDVLTVLQGTLVSSVAANGTEGPFTITLDDGTTHTNKTVLIATGAQRRKLPAKNAEAFEHKGLTYCASCDGPMFSGMDVVVVGGGNAGFESAAQLLAYAKSVTLLQNSDAFKADAVTVKKVLEHEKMTAIMNAKTTEILGEEGGMVTGMRYEDTQTHEEHELTVQGIFVEIGTIPSTDIVKDCVERNEHGHIVVDPRRQRTSHLGIWAAGDCTDGLYCQNNIAAGDAVKAIEDIYAYIKA